MRTVLDNLRDRRRKLASTLDDNLKALERQIEANAKALDAKKQEVKTLDAERRELERRAQQYVQGTAYLDPDLIQTMPFRRSKTGRTRMDIKGSTLALTGLAPTINYRFLNSGELVIAYLDKKAARSWDGKVWPEDRATGELIDLLYQTEDGKGFFTVLAKRGIKIHPMAILTKKAHGRVVKAAVPAGSA